MANAEPHSLGAPSSLLPPQIAILMLNAFVGWYQEKQAGDVVAKLKADIALKALVVRNGQEKEIEARDVVPGDIIIIEVGCLSGRSWHSKLEGRYISLIRTHFPLEQSRTVSLSLLMVASSLITPTEVVSSPRT